MRRKPLLLLFGFLLLFTCEGLRAQSFTISGFVRDSSNGEALVGASVYVRETGTGTGANNYGFYSITLGYGNYHVVYSMGSYREVVKEFFLDSNRVIDVLLAAEKVNTSVVVRANRNISRQVEMSRIDLPMKQVVKVPAILGEVDVIKAIQLLPGVKGGNEGSSGLYVRGGSPDQNLILLDGVPVYNVTHLFGFFSVFNSDAINSIQLYKGGFPARYGGRLSSVLDIGMKEGNAKKLAGTFTLSPITGRLALDGPLGNSGKTTFAVSGRRTFFDLLYRPFLTNENTFFYNFYDFNAKINHKINDKERIFVSVYNGYDKFKAVFRSTTTHGGSTIKESSNASLGWGNSTGVLRYYKVVNRKLFSNYSVNFTNYKYNLGIEADYSEKTDTSFDRFYFLVKYGAGIRDYGVRADYEYSRNAHHKWRFGGLHTLHTFNPGNIRVIVDATGNTKIDTLLGAQRRILSHETALYWEDEFQINPYLKTLYGLRTVSYVADGVYRVMPEPRFGIRQMMSNEVAVKLSYTMMNQPIHLLSNNGQGLPVDIWVPATGKVRPQRAQQVALGITQPWKNDIEFSLEGYYKWMNHVIDYAEGADFVDVSTNWEEKVKAGKGEAYGVEMLLQKKTGKTSGWLGYTLAWSHRTIPDINFGRQYPIKFDRRHQVTFFINHDIDEKWSAQLTFIFSTGSAITLPLGRYFSQDGSVVFDYGSKNGVRMPAYNRMDFGLNNKLKRKSWNGANQTWNLSVYNIYNYFNPYWVEMRNNGSVYKPVGIQVLGFLPAISYTMTW